MKMLRLIPWQYLWNWAKFLLIWCDPFFQWFLEGSSTGVKHFQEILVRGNFFTVLLRVKGCDAAKRKQNVISD